MTYTQTQIEDAVERTCEAARNGDIDQANLGMDEVTRMLFKYVRECSDERQP